jgi:hypothetical protein
VTYQQVRGNTNVVGSGGTTVGPGGAVADGTGNATGQSATATGHSTATTSGGPKKDKSSHWWNNLWLIAIVGGAIAAIAGALVLTLLH